MSKQMGSANHPDPRSLGNWGGRRSLQHAPPYHRQCSGGNIAAMLEQHQLSPDSSRTSDKGEPAGVILAMVCGLWSVVCGPWSVGLQTILDRQQLKQELPLPPPPPHPQTSTSTTSITTTITHHHHHLPPPLLPLPLPLLLPQHTWLPVHLERGQGEPFGSATQPDLR